jgi:hypothetical protein
VITIFLVASFTAVITGAPVGGLELAAEDDLLLCVHVSNVDIDKKRLHVM